MAKKKEAKKKPTAERLRELLCYNSKTGMFRWRVTRTGSALAGTVAGYIDKAGSRIIKVDGHPYLAHRLAWLYVHGVWPATLLDHRDLDRSNNRIANLRLATPSQNMHNRRMQKNNRSGYKGVCRADGRYMARIVVNRGCGRRLSRCFGNALRSV